MNTTLDPTRLPTQFKLSDARKADYGDHPRLLESFLYNGLTVLYSEPGLGKSMLSGQTEEHLAWGRPFGPWVPERPVNCMVIDLEGDARLAAERSLVSTPWGLIASDHDRDNAADIYYWTEWPGDGFFGRLAVLEERLISAREAGIPIGYVRIDTMRLFLGSKPHGVNAYEWDAQCLRRLNQLAMEQRVVLVMVHHTNKAGEVSGSTGVAGSATVVAQLKRNPDNDDECLLQSVKVRVDAPFRHALVMDDRGKWEFSEAITPTQAELGGAKRTVVNVLTARGPMALQDIKEALPDVGHNTLKTALRRLRETGIATYRRGTWQLTQATLQHHPKCHLCGLSMESYEPGQTTHPNCVPDPWAEETVEKFLGHPMVPGQQPAPDPVPEPVAAPVAAEQDDDGPEDEEDHEHPEAARWPARNELLSSVNASRMKPVPRIAKVERDGLPWSLCSEALDGQFKAKAWSGRAPEGTELVAIFDRNGSFPSAMSSVPVAPNRLKHTGPLGADPLERQPLAGLFRIKWPEWDDSKVPHPLGRIIQTACIDGLVWITGSHMELLDKLARDGRMPVVNVVDSWTGRRNTSLFERFYKWTGTVREQTAGADQETREAAKGAIVRAIRSLHPKRVGSPFWRPDWHKAVMAQASVRHWITADRAVQGGAALLSLGYVDEVAFAVPTDTDVPPKLWVPAPYRVGAGYGQVKHKEIKTGPEAVKVISPVTLAEWQARNNRGQR